MKKILAAIFQIAVTLAVLYWVFHDPQKRAQMGVALRSGRLSLDRGRDSRLSRGRVRGRGALAHFAQGAADPSQHPAGLGALFNRDVLQPIPARRHRRRHHEELSPAQGDARESDRRAPRGRLRSHGRAGRAHRHHRRPDRPALRLADPAPGDTPPRLDPARHPRQRGPDAGHFVCRERGESRAQIAAAISRTRKTDRALGGLSSLRASLARHPRGFGRVDRSPISRPSRLSSASPTPSGPRSR